MGQLYGEIPFASWAKDRRGHRIRQEPNRLGAGRGQQRRVYRTAPVILYYSKTDSPYFEPFTLEWESPEAYAKARKQKILIDDETGKKYVLSDAGGGKRVKRFLEEAMKDGRPIDDV